MSVEIIAELSTNFCGDLDLAFEFIREFSPYTDVIKIQSPRIKHLQPDDPQYAWMSNSELSDRDHFLIQEECQAIGVSFLTTVFNADEVPLVERLGCKRIKVGSGEAGNERLASAIFDAGLEPLVSCGLVEPAQSAFYGMPGVQFLGCVTRYPAPCGIAYAMMKANPDLVGFSDHSVGLNECRAAIVAGAKIIECHVQLPHQARATRAFEKTVDNMRELRAFADDDPTRFQSRWQHA